MRTFTQLAKDTGVSRSRLYKKFLAMGLTPAYNNYGYTLVSDEQAEMICKEEPPKEDTHISIIHLFRTLKDNRVKVIADNLNVSQAHVHGVINNYLTGKLGYVIVESKMNGNEDCYEQLRSQRRELNH